MARDTVAITTLSVDAGTPEGAGVSINPEDGAVLSVGGNARKLLIVVDNVTEDAADVIVVAPSGNAHAPRSSLGDLTVSVAAGSRGFLMVESARFAQSNGDIFLDFSADAEGTISAYRLPAGG